VDWDVKFKDLVWWKRLLGFRSKEAEKFMDNTDQLFRRASDAVHKHDYTYEEVMDLVDEMMDIIVIVDALTELPDAGQRREGERVFDQFITLLRSLKYEAKKAAERDDVAAEAEQELKDLEVEAERQANRDRRTMERAKRHMSGLPEPDEPEEYSKWEGGGMKFRKKGFDQRRGGYRSRSYGSVGVVPKGDPYGGDLSMDDLEESAISKLKRIIREEVKKATK